MVSEKTVPSLTQANYNFLAFFLFSDMCRDFTAELNETAFNVHQIYRLHTYPCHFYTFFKPLTV